VKILSQVFHFISGSRSPLSFNMSYRLTNAIRVLVLGGILLIELESHDDHVLFPPLPYAALSRLHCSLFCNHFYSLYLS
jgi:hypothetical protein